MDPITLFALAALVLVAIAVVTPQGRKGLVGIGNLVGSLFGRGAERLTTTEDQRVQLEARTEAEARAGLTQAQSANASAQQIIQDDEAQAAELAKWTANRDAAAQTLRHLREDAVPDAEQSQKIGQALSIGETAMAKINGITAARQANATNVANAHDALVRSAALMRQLPERAQALMAQGNVAAAAKELATAETSLAAGQSAFSDSGATKLVQQMQRDASRAQTRASAAQTRASAAPLSADIAASQLANMGQTSSFEDFVASSTPVAPANK